MKTDARVAVPTGLRGLAAVGACASGDRCFWGGETCPRTSANRSGRPAREATP